MIFEKTISGMYLGEIVWRVLVKMAQVSDLFAHSFADRLAEPFVLRTPHFDFGTNGPFQTSCQCTCFLWPGMDHINGGQCKVSWTCVCRSKVLEGLRSCIWRSCTWRSL